MNPILFPKHRILFFMVLLSSLICSFVGADEKYNHLHVYHSNLAQIDNFSFPSTAGRSLSLHDLQGQVILLAFFATWCPQCNSELPELVHIQNLYQDRGLSVLAISIDSGPLSKVKNWVREKGLNYPVLHDQTYSVRTSHDVKLVPTVFVLDRHLNKAAEVVGEINWNSKKAQDLFERLLSAYQ